jgi:hypothetical protein
MMNVSVVNRELVFEHFRCQFLTPVSLPVNRIESIFAVDVFHSVFILWFEAFWRGCFPSGI